MTSPIIVPSYVSPRVRRFMDQQRDGVKIQPPPPFVETRFGRLDTIPWHLGDAGFADPKNFSTPPHIVGAIVDYLVQGTGRNKLDRDNVKNEVLRMLDGFRDGSLTASELFMALAEFQARRNTGERYSGAYYDVSVTDRFKELIAQERRRDGSVCIDPKQDIILMDSGSQAFDYLIKILGCKVLMPKPNFFTYHVVSNFYSALEGNLDLLRRKAVLYDCDEDGMPKLDEIRRKVREDSEIKAILVINPNNPTGANYSRELLQEIVQIAEENGLLIIADQVYNQLTLNMDRAVLLHELTTDVPIVEIMSFSKEYLMAGFRLGALAFYNVNAALAEVREIARKLDQQRMASNIVSCVGGVAALEGSREHIGQMKEIFRRRREVFKGIDEIPGLKFIPPEAAFYGRIICSGRTGTEFATELLDGAAIATIPGDAFAFSDDPMPYPFTRVTLLTDERRIQEGIERISRLYSKK
ncbi:pyridoxal phosphate-dependent aminotransferase [Candidatus Micrarchaeota archaeon]|nr:pyridoxal phosphate-dependent aminotransferase [Candidatus Micrarchaeota archaeon]